MARSFRLPSGQLPVPDNQKTPPDQDMAYLKKLCSRLAGDALCRCGGNLSGRYCLWSYYRIRPELAGLETSVDGKDGKV